MRQRAFTRLAQGCGPVLLGLLTVTIGSAWRDALAGPLPSQPPAGPTTEDRLHWRLAGVASCSAVACHNQGAARNEYATWINQDKHARAYGVLFDQRARRIQKNLDPMGQAHTNTLCLKCHVSQNFETERLNPGFEMADGVHCESCHGPAEGWLAAHYLPSWQGMTVSAKAALGFQPTKNLLVRAQGCVDCHVGSPRQGADVNHDLIAAGHPRLNFEFSSYLATYPRHWRLAEDKQRYPDLEARAWAIGQVVSAKRSLELLAWRAENKDGARPWPELADYHCFACHQALTPEVKRRTTGLQRPLRLPGWNTWYLTLTPKLAGDHHAEVARSLNDLGQHMAALRSDRSKVAVEANHAAHKLDELLAHLTRSPFQAEAAQALFRSIAQGDPKRAAATWDEAAQRYLALVALYQTIGDLKPEAPHRQHIKEGLEGVLKALQFPQGFDSPVPGYRPAEVQPRFEALRSDVGK